MLLVNRMLCCFLWFLVISSAAFQPQHPSPIGAQTRIRRSAKTHTADYNQISKSLLIRSVSTREIEQQATIPAHKYETVEALNEAITSQCLAGNLNDAVDLIHSIDQDSSIKPTDDNLEVVLNALAKCHQEVAAKQGERLLRRMSNPTGRAYSAVIMAHANSRHSQAAQRADALLDTLWLRYNATQSKQNLPTRATYTSVMAAWARSNKGKQAAERAEELLEEMEAHYRKGLTMLGPTTACVNAVLNAWSKSNDKGAADRCQQILTRMEGLAMNEGRRELQPDTVSFNTVIDALAQSQQRGAQRKAEALLERMDTLSKGETAFSCEPDTLSFNSVINSWAKSREPAADNRAEAILLHMEKRYETNATRVAPDSSTYNSVIHAWSRSRDPDAPQRADAVLKRMETAYENGNVKACPDATTYNSLINVWAKSRNARAGERAVEILQLMKTFQNRPDCRPDVYTYTSVIDALTKRGSPSAAEQAVELLDELEDEYKFLRDDRLKPNVRLYTAAINAISKSKQDPERAEALLRRRLESSDDLQPDRICYNAVINCWGWSNAEQKSQRAFELYQQMMLGKNPNVKPDIITCNSLLNACAFERTRSDTDRAATMQIAITVLEEFSSQAPKYGWPNHISYSNMLLTIARQMPLSEKRFDLAEATFWQCCKAGHVSALVISSLHSALADVERFESIMGSALKSNSKTKFSYDMRKLPREWKRFAPQQQRKR